MGVSEVYWRCIRGCIGGVSEDVSVDIIVVPLPGDSWFDDLYSFHVLLLSGDFLFFDTIGLHQSVNFSRASILHKQISLVECLIRINCA